MPDSFSLSGIMFIDQIKVIVATVDAFDLLDVMLVAAIFYKLYQMIEDTRAITLIKGVATLALLTILCNLVNLHAVYWLMQKAMTFLLVALPIVFQPELRRALEHIGKGTFFGSSGIVDDEEARRIVNAIEKAVTTMSENRIGALLVFERGMGLKDICATGIQLDGLITSELLINIFMVNTPLHDGAVVVRDKRILAAGCILPLTDNRSLSTELGTRHRAAIGLSEQCDALVLIVSEETGIISVAEDGHIRRRLDSESVRMNLWPIFAPENIKFKDLVANWRKKKK